MTSSRPGRADQYFPISFFVVSDPFARLIESMLNNFEILFRHSETLAILKRFSVGYVLHVSMMRRHNCPDRVQIRPEELFPRVCLVDAKPVKLSMNV